MRIDRDGGMAKGGVENDIGGFTANARQAFQRLAVFGYLAVVFLAEDFTGLDNIFGLGVKQTDGFNVFFQAAFL